MSALRYCLGVLIAATIALPVHATDLVMVEQPGCAWCAKWDAEIAPAYPNTREGAFAPLVRVDLRDLPDDLVILRRVTFTPTFLLVQDGHEIARIEGYPGADFFWPILESLLIKHTDFKKENS